MAMSMDLPLQGQMENMFGQKLNWTVREISSFGVSKSPNRNTCDTLRQIIPMMSISIILRTCRLVCLRLWIEGIYLKNNTKSKAKGRKEKFAFSKQSLLSSMRNIKDSEPAI